MTISSDDEVDDGVDINPSVPTNAFRGQMIDRTDSVITLDQSEDESENDCIVIKSTDPRPSSSQVCLISDEEDDDGDLSDSDFNQRYKRLIGKCH